MPKNTHSIFQSDFSEFATHLEKKTYIQEVQGAIILNLILGFLNLTNDISLYFPTQQF